MPETMAYSTLPMLGKHAGSKIFGIHWKLLPQNESATEFAASKTLSCSSVFEKEQIHLEACPTCNVQTDCYDTYADHPIDRLYRAGISIGVNTDTRTISDITLNEEYEKLHQTFGWGNEDFYRCNVNALKAAFIPDDVRGSSWKDCLKVINRRYEILNFVNDVKGKLTVH